MQPVRLIHTENIESVLVENPVTTCNSIEMLATVQYHSYTETEFSTEQNNQRTLFFLAYQTFSDFSIQVQMLVHNAPVICNQCPPPPTRKGGGLSARLKCGQLLKLTGEMTGF